MVKLAPFPSTVLSKTRMFLDFSVKAGKLFGYKMPSRLTKNSAHGLVPFQHVTRDFKAVLL